MADNRDVNHGRARPCYLWLLQSRAKTDQEHRFALGPNTELGPKKPSQFKGRPLCRRGNPPTLPGNFAGHSIAPKQNDIDDPSEFPVLIETYRRIDIGLHPVTYNDSTTTYQMGVPAVTLAGENFCAHTNARILRNLGLDELITESEEDYVLASVRLAEDAPRRAELRIGLRETILNARSCDPAAFTLKL